MKRITDERVIAIPHDLFRDCESDTDSATSNIDKDKRENLQLNPDDDRNYFTHTSGICDIVKGINPTLSGTNQEIPSISNNQARVGTLQNKNPAEPCKNPTYKEIPDKFKRQAQAPILQNEKPVMPLKNPTVEEMNPLLDEVALEVKRSIVGPLFAKRSGPGISIIWTSSTRPTSVVVEIFVSSSGKVEVYAKGYQLNTDHTLWTHLKMIAPVALAHGQVQQFVQHVNHAVMVTRGFTLCAGVTEQKHLWNNLDKVFIERNQFREPDVCRLESCELLVTPQRVRCGDCKSLWTKIRSRKKKKTAD